MLQGFGRSALSVRHAEVLGKSCALYFHCPHQTESAAHFSRTRPWNPPGVASPRVGGRIFGRSAGGDFPGAGVGSGGDTGASALRRTASACGRSRTRAGAASIACDAFSALIRSASSAAVGSPSADVPDSTDFSRSRKPINSSR